MLKLLTLVAALAVTVNLYCEGIHLDFSYKEVTYCTDIPKSDSPVSIYRATATDDSRLEVLATLVSQDEKQAVLHLSWLMQKPDGTKQETVWNGIKVLLGKETPFTAESAPSPYLILKALPLQ